MALRPEMTPTLARMVGAHHRDYKKPIKWFAIPQLFRYEKQQRGRLREHFQFNADIIGESDVSADAELIALAIDTLRSFGLTEGDFVVRYCDRHAWQRFFERWGLSEDAQYAAFQAVDRMERESTEKTRDRLTALSLSSSAVNDILALAEGRSRADTPEMQFVWDLLGDLNRFCRIDYKIVRGLAYYTGIVWEIHDRKGELRAIAGGGRYDNLLKLVSGVDLPALGFGMGDVVLGELLKDRGLLPKLDWQLDCYVVIADESLRGEALKLIHQLRDAGIAIDYGHLQDFPWREWVHRSLEPTCMQPLRLRSTGGASLSAQTVECDCGKSRNLAGITEAEPVGSPRYPRTTLSAELAAGENEYLCRGAMPWHGEDGGRECGLLVRREFGAASNLYYALVKSSIYLPRATATVPEKDPSAGHAAAIHFDQPATSAGRARPTGARNFGASRGKSSSPTPTPKFGMRSTSSARRLHSPKR